MYSDAEESGGESRCGQSTTLHQAAPCSRRKNTITEDELMRKPASCEHTNTPRKRYAISCDSVSGIRSDAGDSEDDDDVPTKRKRHLGNGGGVGRRCGGKSGTKYNRYEAMREEFSRQKIETKGCVLIFDIDGTLLREDKQDEMVLMGEAAAAVQLAYNLNFRIGIWTAASKGHFDNFMRLFKEHCDVTYVFTRAGLDKNGRKNCQLVRQTLKSKYKGPFILIDNNKKILEHSSFDYTINITKFISGKENIICIQQLLKCIYDCVDDWNN